jgi:hypothetical protein
MLRLVKAIFVSWLVGVICGIAIVIAVQQEYAPPITARSQAAYER